MYSHAECHIFVIVGDIMLIAVMLAEVEMCHMSYRYADRHYVVSHFFHVIVNVYAECHYAVCSYAECPSFLLCEVP